MSSETLTILKEISQEIEGVIEIVADMEANTPKTARDEAIRNLRKIGMTSAAIAHRFHLSRGSVFKATKGYEYRRDLPHREKPARKARHTDMKKRAETRDWSVAIEMYITGEATAQQLADLYGVSKQRMHVVLNESGARAERQKRIAQAEDEAVALLLDITMSLDDIQELTRVPISRLKKLMPAELAEQRKKLRADFRPWPGELRTSRYDDDLLAYQEGKMSVLEIAEKHGVSGNAIYSALRTRGIPCRGTPRLSHKRHGKRKQILELYVNNKMRPHLIAEQLGITPRTVYHHLYLARAHGDLKSEVSNDQN